MGSEGGAGGMEIMMLLLVRNDTLPDVLIPPNDTERERTKERERILERERESWGRDRRLEDAVTKNKAKIEDIKK